MEFYIYLIIMIIMLIISDLTRPVPKSPKKPGLGDFQFPTADATRKVPVIWGKPMLRGPNVTWYGALKIEKITKVVKGVFTDKEYTAGYKYHIGLHMAFNVSDGDTRLLKIQVGDDVVWTGNLLRGRQYINKGEIWGGEEAEGGVQGEFDWCPGGLIQNQNSYLRQRLGSRVPAYRSTARLVWRGGYLGTSKYIKEWAAQCQRLPNLLNTTYFDIDGEANPAEMLYEILMNKTWGLGASILDVDVNSFTSSAKILYDENFGLSMLWDGAKTLRDISNDILSHIDGLLFVNVLTGRWELKLNRAPTQAEIDALDDGFVFNEDNISELETFSRPTLDETTNEVNVIWTQDGETTTWPAKAQDLGLFQVHDKQFISVDQTYQGVTSYELAQRLATRDLRVLSYPLVKVSFKVNREAYKLKPGSRFKFSWGPLSVDNIVMVVLGVDYGTLDDNLISVDAIQDVFQLGTGLYSGGGDSGWEPPNRLPLPPTVYRMEFTPFWLMSVDSNIVNPESAVPMLMVEVPSDSHQSYDIEYQDPTTGGAFAPGIYSQPFTPTAILQYDYLETPGTDSSSTLIISDFKGGGDFAVPTQADIQYLANGLMVVDSEIMAYGAINVRDDGSYAISKVYRGLLDSTISRHLAGARVWFISEGVGRTPTELYPFAPGTYRAKLISRALGGLLDVEAAPTVSLTTNGTTSNARPLYAYPPRDLTVNGSRVPLVVSGNVLAVAWKPRNRYQETYIFLQETTATVTNEVGVTYRARLYNHESTMLMDSGEIATNNYTFTVTGAMPAAGYITVIATRAGYGPSAAATIWFGQSVDYSAGADSAPQRFLEEAGSWQFLRMAD